MARLYFMRVIIRISNDLISFRDSMNHLFHFLSNLKVLSVNREQNLPIFLHSVHSKMLQRILK